MTLVVDMEAVVDRMALHIGDESCDIDDSQHEPFWNTNIGHATATVRHREATLQPMYQDVASLFGSIATTVGEALRANREWGPSGLRDGQYAVDLVADRIVLDALAAADLSVLSEESGLTLRGGSTLVIVDPLDGSTNASHGVPWYATSLCLVDDNGPAVSLVRNQASGATYTATRGGGAWCDGRRMTATSCTNIGDAFVGLSGLPPAHLGWRQFRALGAAALDLCLVAAGVLDGFIDCSVDAHGVWDYAGGALICAEAGAMVADALDRDLIVRDPSLRRTPVAASTPDLLAQLLAARRTFT
jgi:fructose-1,6-bisphosphatase/inositol monophosphatase family enzyme